MGVKAEQLKAELLARLSAAVGDKMPADKAASVSRFVRQFYANVPPADLIGVEAEDAYGAALALWRFAAHRKPGTAKVRVYNPAVAEHGWRSRRTIIEVVNDDMPFLVDSVTAVLNRLNLTVHLVIHPIMRVVREAAGGLAAIAEPGGPPPAGAVAESIMRIEIGEQTDKATLDKIRQDLERVLGDVRAAVSDWRAMRQKLRELCDRLAHDKPAVAQDEVDEARAFLAWLDDDHYTYLGYREYRYVGTGENAHLEVVEGSGLGILHDVERRVFDDRRQFGRMAPEIVRFILAPQLLHIVKANRRSTVHRSVHMDTVGIKRIDKNGRVVGEYRFVGLFTSLAYSISPRLIPVLRRKVEAVQARTGFPAASHDGKALAHILDAFPRDELFQITVDNLFETAMGILHLQERQRIALFVRKDALERYVSCLLFVPRDRLNTELRLRLLDIIARAHNGAVSAFYTHVTDEALARLHVIVRTKRGQVPAVDVGELEAQLIEAGRTWPDRLRQALAERHGEERGNALCAAYAEAFPAAYRERFSDQVAVEDIGLLEQAHGGEGLAMTLYRAAEAGPQELGFKLFRRGAPVALSDVLPMLENMGVRAISEMPFAIAGKNGAPPVWIHDFVLNVPPAAASDGALDLGAVRPPFHDVFAKVWRGEVENDGFNRLVLRAGLDARAIVVLRAYAKYLRQAAFTFSQSYIEQTLAAHPRIACKLVALFAARFDPQAKNEERDAIERGLAAEVEHDLDAVANLDEDRILRRYLNLVLATLRTNHYQADAKGEPKAYLSFKLDSRKVDELPLPRPLVEIFVYSPRTEGVHLRGGRVARGGIRWSDRREDFRTEVLGLMKAQMVKNAVIVPVGSKGGFVVKRPPATGGREAFLAEGVECYKTLIRGMLDITDTIAPDKVKSPARVVRRDGDDPYLVVAADKGTATFSDIANGVSVEYGFWLGDAFASGGSAGYDHKKMAITARGAWESVKRHFREMGHDTQSRDFTVVGVGDMSGDVFGNGMLLSPHIKLIGAFDHRHVFLDPDPDPAKSWAERKRLFALARSSWADYDKGLIAKGGGVFERTLKSIKLAPEVRRVLGIEPDSLTPAELIKAMLKAPVDLLWFGGIGTYVKAKAETHAEVGDRATDAVRVDASALRCKAVGEGANLGMTQRARIEYGLAGGRGNTDAVDNSAGVDCSDHEVNIKVLLNDVVAAGDMTGKQRDKLLAQMTEEVGRLVLRDNYEQTQILSVTETQGPALLDQHAQMMRDFERAGRLDRAIEFLPDDEALAARQAQGKGLTRPELAVLLAYAKMALYDALLPSDLPDDPWLEGELVGYFPPELGRKYRAEIARHRLRREIIATVVTNDLVNLTGPGFAQQMGGDSGRPAQDVARAYLVVRAAFGLKELREAVEALDGKVPAPAQYAMFAEMQRLIDRAVRWFLAAMPPQAELGRTIERFAAGVAAVAAGLDGLLGAAEAQDLSARAKGFSDQGAGAELAKRIAALDPLGAAPEIVRIAEPTKLGVPDVARLYFAVGARFGLDWLQHAAAGAAVGGRWQKRAVAALAGEIDAIQGQLCAGLIAALGEKARTVEPEAAIAAWVKTREAAARRADEVIADVKAAGRVDLAMLAVATRQLRALAGG